MILPLLWRPIAAPPVTPPAPQNDDADLDALMTDAYEPPSREDVMKARNRTLSDLDPAVMNAARAQMKKFGPKSAAFLGTAKMVAAYGMMPLDRASQLRMLKAVASRPNDKKFHDVVRRLLTHEGFRDLDAKTLDDVVTAFEQMSTAEAERCQKALKNGTISLERIAGRARVIIDGVRFAIDDSKGPFDKKELERIATAVNRANDLIKDPKRRITEVVIADTTTRFSLYEGKSILMLSPKDATGGVATHEAGHAVFHALRAEHGQDVALRVTDVYRRLANTKPKDGRPAGLLIFDPSQWSKTIPSEHPWDDADEMFASALRAYHTDRPALMKTIARFDKIDPAAGRAARDLVAILDELHGRNASTKPLSNDARKAAKSTLDGIPLANDLKDTVWARFGMESVRSALGLVP